MKNRLFHRDFTLVVFGQIISLFGNGILRFALPLYLLDKSGSPALFGMVSALAFLPMIILTPLGGIIADRVNKRNIMVVLDFSTAGLIVLFSLLMNRLDFVALLTVMLMLLYGIQGAYQPTVQASMPLLATPENLLPANAVINQVNALSGLLSPALGGILYRFQGIGPILVVSVLCFLFSAVMELFIRIPSPPVRERQSMLAIVRGDLKESLSFIIHDRPIIWKALGVVCALNLFLSALIIVGVPVIVTQVLGLSGELYGFAQALCAAGSLLGGILVGVLHKRLRVNNSWLLLAISTVLLVPVGLSLLAGAPVLVSYAVLSVCFLVMMSAATMFSIQMLAFVQAETPAHLIGKVISCVLSFSMCSQPLGQAMYGVLFEVVHPGLVVLLGAAVSTVTALLSRRVFSRLRATGGGQLPQEIQG